MLSRMSAVAPEISAQECQLTAIQILWIRFSNLIETQAKCSQIFGGGLMMTPHGIDVDAEGNVWVTDFAGNEEARKGIRFISLAPRVNFHEPRRARADGQRWRSFQSAE